MSTKQSSNVPNYPSDEVLLSEYLQGDDEPVGWWTEVIYFRRLWLYASSILRQDKERARDALHDTALKLCELKPAAIRTDKFVSEAEQVPAALRTRVFVACMLIVRRAGWKLERSYEASELPHTQTEDPIAEIDQQMLRKFQKDLIKDYFLRRELNAEWAYLEAYFEYGKATRKYLTVEKNLDKKEVHNLIERTNRHLKILAHRHQQTKNV